jgi:hypothetical protein
MLVAEHRSSKRGAARQPRQFWWIPKAIADAAGRTRQLRLHDGVGPGSSQCPYIVLVTMHDRCPCSLM